MKQYHIDIRRHSAIIISGKCHWGDSWPWKYHVEMDVYPYPGAGPLRIVKEIDHQSARGYNTDGPLCAGVLLGETPPWNCSTVNFISMNLLNPEDSRILCAFPGTALESLASMAWSIHIACNCGHQAACRYLATGSIPDWLPIRIDERRTFTTDLGIDTIELTVAPYLSPETVMRAYELTWRLYHGAKEVKTRRRRGINGTTSAIYTFVKQQQRSFNMTGAMSIEQRRQIYSSWSWPGEIPEKSRSMKRFYEIYARAHKSVETVSPSMR